jgi:hypothetical protein
MDHELGVHDRSGGVRRPRSRPTAAGVAAAALVVLSTVTGATVARSLAAVPAVGGLRATVDAVVMAKQFGSVGPSAPVATTPSGAPTGSTTPTAPTTTGMPAPTTTTTSTTPTTTVPVPVPSAPRPSVRGVKSAPTTSTTTTTTTAPSLAGIATDCSTDVSAALDAYLAALPDGAVFTSPPTACYLADEGIKITHPVSVVGGRFEDHSTVVPPRLPGRGAPSLHPIVLIKETSDVTIAGVDLVGADLTGTYHAALVGQSGIDVRSSSNVTITDVSTLDTFGDGLTLFLAAGHGKDRNITVDGLTVTRAGRQGVTPAFVSGATFSHVDIVSTADSAWDFESDLPTMGTGNITISDSTWKGRVNLIEPLTGPLTFINDHGSGSLLFDDATNQPIAVTDSTLLLPADDWGTPAAGIVLHGGSLTFSHDTLGRVPSKKPPTGPAWHVTGTGHLTFVDTSVAAPLGSSSGTAVVTFRR